MRDRPIWVVAGALRGPKRTWLMHQRPKEKAHGGLWEFPGGKVEGAEIPSETLIRELREELGIIVDLSSSTPAAFAEEQRIPGTRPIVILLYTIDDWVGLPEALEGGSLGWFSSQEIARLPKPPLDELLTAQMSENRK